MKIDFRNKRYSIILAGILIAFIASITTVIILGLRGFEVHSFYKVESTYMEKPHDELTQNIIMTSLEECSREHQLVPGAEVAFDIGHDVAAGWVNIDYNVPYEFPISITEDYIDLNFDITVSSYGGYTPDTLGINYMVLYQPKTGKGGILDITWDEGVQSLPYSTMEYSASFDIMGEEPIVLESNHLPDIINGDPDFTFLLEAEPTPDLGKWVHVGVFSSWEGCPDPNQKFKLILAHYHCVPRISKSQSKI